MNDRTKRPIFQPHERVSGKMIASPELQLVFEGTVLRVTYGADGNVVHDIRLEKASGNHHKPDVIYYSINDILTDWEWDTEEASGYTNHRTLNVAIALDSDKAFDNLRTEFRAIAEPQQRATSIRHFVEAQLPSLLRPVKLPLQDQGWLPGALEDARRDSAGPVAEGILTVEQGIVCELSDALKDRALELHPGSDQYNALATILGHEVQGLPWDDIAQAIVSGTDHPALHLTYGDLAKRGLDAVNWLELATDMEEG